MPTGFVLHGLNFGQGRLSPSALGSNLFQAGLYYFEGEG